MRVYERIAETLAENGVEAVFGVMGEGNLELIAYLTSSCGVRYYAARQEAGAVLMADGYSRVSQNVGVCTVTQGPGFTNALTALTAAARNGSRVLLLAADTPHGELLHPQRVDETLLAHAVGATVLAVRDPESAGDRVVEALETAGSGSPVVLRAPTDVQKLEPAGPASRRARHRGQTGGPADAAAVAAAADALARSSRPVVVAGRGAVAASARDELEALAERLGAVLATSLPANGFFRGNPYSIGVLGGFSSALAVELLEEADCYVVFGADLNPWQTRGGTLLRGAAVIQCDLVPAQIGRNAPVTVGVVGDARATAAAIDAELERRGSGGTGYRTAETARAIAEYDPAGEFEDESRDGEVDPRSLTLALEAALPAERTVVVDGGHFTGYPCMYMSVPDPEGFVFAIDFGATGLGLATAIGAAVGRPDRLAVAVVGDGGLMMSLPELDTAVRYRLPVAIIVMNDGAYGSEVHHLRLRDLPDREAFFETPSFATIAEGFGARGLTVSSAAELASLPAALGDVDRPLVVDARINGELMADWFRTFARRAALSGRWT